MFWKSLKNKFFGEKAIDETAKSLLSDQGTDLNSLLLNVRDIRKERIAHFKEIKVLANVLLAENKAIKDTHKASWEGKVIENNIKRLKDVIHQANQALGDEALHDYSNGSLRQQLQLLGEGSFFGRPEILNHLRNFTYGADRFEVLRYSPGYSIGYDLHWLTAGTVGEQNDIALGKISPDVLEKYCPELIVEISVKLIPYLKAKPGYATSANLLEQVTGNFHKNSFLISNILLITITESIVRELAAFVYGKQNPSLTAQEIDKYINGEFLSLEGLVDRGRWTEDFPMKLSEAYALSKYLDDPSLEKVAKMVELHKDANKDIREKLVEIQTELANTTEQEYRDHLTAKVKTIVQQMEETGRGLLNPTTDIVHVSLRTKLQFLLRRYKEDRNSIIHGQYTNFDKGWKSFVYLSALVKVFEVIRGYDDVYNTPQ